VQFAVRVVLSRDCLFVFCRQNLTLSSHDLKTRCSRHLDPQSIERYLPGVQGDCFLNGNTRKLRHTTQMGNPQREEKHR
jgi:hypothetical protein